MNNISGIARSLIFPALFERSRGDGPGGSFVSLVVVPRGGTSPSISCMYLPTLLDILVKVLHQETSQETDPLPVLSQQEEISQAPGGSLETNFGQPKFVVF